MLEGQNYKRLILIIDDVQQIVYDTKLITLRYADFGVYIKIFPK